MFWNSSWILRSWVTTQWNRSLLHNTLMDIHELSESVCVQVVSLPINHIRYETIQLHIFQRYRDINHFSTGQLFKIYLFKILLTEWNCLTRVVSFFTYYAIIFKEFCNMYISVKDHLDDDSSTQRLLFLWKLFSLIHTLP